MSIELMKRALEFITGVYFGEHEGSRADREKLEADLTTAIQQAEAQQPATGEPVLTVEREPDYWSGGHFYEGSRPHINPTKVWSLPIGTKLYTRPAPSVPDEKPLPDLMMASYHEAIGWNACRAAMLAAKDYK